MEKNNPEPLTETEAIETLLKNALVKFYKLDIEHGCIMIGFDCIDEKGRGLTIFPIAQDGKLGLKVALTEGGK